MGGLISKQGECERREHENLEVIMQLPSYDFDDSDEDSNDRKPKREQWLIDVSITVSNKVRVWRRYLGEWKRDVADYGERKSWKMLERKVDIETERIERTGSTYNASKMWDKRVFLLKFLKKEDLRNTAEYDELRTRNRDWLSSKEILRDDLTEECSICFDSNERCLYKLRCDHVFHWGCIRDWLDSLVRKGSPLTCPMCRSEVSCRRLEVPDILSQQNLRVLSELPFYDFTEEEKKVQHNLELLTELPQLEKGEEYPYRTLIKFVNERRRMSI
jgi:hypothetical protein